MAMTAYGVIKWFNPSRQFGFITPDGAQHGDADDVYLSARHCNGFVPHEKQRVKFQMQEARGQRAPAAINVELL